MANIHNIEEHSYNFWTDVFGLDSKGRPIKVQGKEHYKKLMRMGGYVPYEEACDIAAENQPKRKKYKASDKLISFLKHMYHKPKTKNGEIQLSGKEIEAMKDLGVDFSAHEKLNEVY